MAQIEVESALIEPESLKEFCYQLLLQANLREHDAGLVADTLVESNLRGIDSHGVARLPHYLERIRQQSIQPRPEMQWEPLGDAVGRVDGDHGLGQLAMVKAADHAVELARESGAGWVSICNSSHCGALAYYGLRIAEAGMIGFAFTHVDPMVTPHGAAEPFCGTNPICMTAPGKEGKSLCLDMATSITPWNTIANAATEGVSIPGDWALDANGRGTTDPNEVVALFPFGGFKGSGLGLMIDVLCALLGGAPIGPDIPKMYGDLTQRRLLGGMVGAIDISRFTEVETFQDRIEELIQRWGAVKPLKEGGKVYYPGEPEALTRVERLQSGIPVGLRLINQFNELASAGGLPPLETTEPICEDVTSSEVEVSPT
ncbi:putative oxidoreductase YjmC [Gimesia maris]|uniref:Ldh family oxidoreductase n=1 Tax=Gimesia maris TaxID=122 RepID=UPI00118D54B0|nr:Ldh family oxidoreductase [Gimesia maris]QDU13772.1 putative oxidoreductase YjmC [Gimesia maris]